MYEAHEKGQAIMPKHRLSWREGRATPEVNAVGSKRAKKSAGGKVIASRMATEAEERQIVKGQWVRTRPPGQAGKKSSVRPQLAKKQKHRISD